MNGRHWFTGCCIAIAASTLLLACGGGGSSGSTSGSTATTSTTTTGTAANTASGVLTAFGSVFVNGTEYTTTTTTSVVDGDADDAASTASALRVGMHVDVSASSGTASLLRYTSAVRGEVDAVDTAASTLTVMGQTVVVSSSTAFAGSTTVSGTTTALTALSNVSVGDYVVVYGFLDCASSTSSSSCSTGTTNILASLVYEPATTGIYRVAGYAESVSSTAKSFVINGLTVDYTTSGSSATSCTPSPCSFTAGEFVVVRSSTAPSSSSGSLTLTATAIKESSYAPVLVSGETASIEGPVSSLDTSADTFVVRGVTVSGSALASTVATLANGEIVQVTGTVTSSGGITATAITVEQRATFTVIAPLTAESASTDTLVALGQTFTVNSSTNFVDRAKDVRPFNLSNFATVLAVGDQVVVSGYTGSSGNIATRVERIPTPTTAYVAVQGVVSADSASGDTLTIGGVTVTLNSSTTLAYAGSGSSTSLAAFFDAVVVGTSVVTASGTAGSTAGTMTAASAGLLDATCGWASAAY